ncbi:hypothetical protein [Accumulibacter sp.]|uniref:hypothetical protein n=1 Tax=Accumulibacter sp. TaxID=2053492 RepID=UPI0028C4BD65|nr:hypothetical protein [Accumulibacter sp.]
MSAVLMPQILSANGARRRPRAPRIGERFRRQGVAAGAALTGLSPASGEGVVLRRVGASRDVVGRISF